MGQITVDQSHQVMATLTTHVCWQEVDFDAAMLQDAIIRDPKGAGKRFTEFLKYQAKLAIKEPKFVRTKPFDLVKFLGKNCAVWRGSLDGHGLEGLENIGMCFPIATEIEISKFHFVTQEGAMWKEISGREKISSLKKQESDFMPFGADVFLGLWEDYVANKWRSILEWLYWNRNIDWMDFPGIILRDKYGNPCIICLFRCTDRTWTWRARPLGSGWRVNYPSVGYKIDH